ncbi:hypothetical protein [Cupriavidus sp. BIC8F]|uniref:hypothetical protein n=1 Tax=Cupriavidus sp. BIC8F TaxID=3079014 RepID=UPI002916FE21|nr:hypothetical protein [Cupriavidus sp. BIC8F]
MATVERTAYLHFPKVFSAAELQALSGHYTGPTQFGLPIFGNFEPIRPGEISETAVNRSVAGNRARLKSRQA